MKLVAENISRAYFRPGSNTNYFYALEKTDLSLEEGAVTALTGRSGSGKTTLSNVLVGLLTPTEGRVLAGGEDIYAMGDEKRSRFRNRHFGIIPQGHTPVMSLTVMENILLPSKMYSRPDASGRARELMERLEIAELGDVFASSLSGGELRRMAIVRALCTAPDIIIADEPTNDLDDVSVDSLLKILREEADRGASVLMITHEEKAAKAADIRLRMERGTVKG